MQDEARSTGVPDAVLAVLTQLVLGISLATSAVPPVVVSFQDRASETIGVFLIIVITAIIAFPARFLFGRHDISSSEYILAVLAPIATRPDLGLLIWVNVNKAFLWASEMHYMSKVESYCIELLILASCVWHNGENRIFDPEFGSHGGDAGMLMYSIQRDYHPKIATGNLLPWIGHVTLYPFAVVFYAVLQIISQCGLLFLVLMTRLFEDPFSPRRHKNMKQRGSILEVMLARRSVQPRKLFMRREAAAIFDRNQHVLKQSRRVVRRKWALLGGVDAIVQHQHFKRIFSISYPMRVSRVYQRVLADSVNRDILNVLNKEWGLFTDYADNPLSEIGDAASRQVLMYAVLGWRSFPNYSEKCTENLRRFEEENMAAWKETERRLEGVDMAMSEFISVRDILRRNLVQLIMLAWWDGLGECQDDESVEDVLQDLSNNFLKGAQLGAEMVIRLCQMSSLWNDSRQKSEMIRSLRKGGGLKSGCDCAVCLEMSQRRRLKNERFQWGLNVDQLQDELESQNCRDGREIVAIWKGAVAGWVDAIFVV